MASHEYAIFGNRGGSHQLLETSLDGEDSMLEELRFLVDRPAGHVGTEVVWSPYWGCSPLGCWWVLWRGEEDRDAPRRNMVRSRAALVRQDAVGLTNTLHDLFDYLSFDGSGADAPPMSEVADALARDRRPVVVPDISTAPLLLLSLWPRLWPAARRRLSLRTLFGSEGVESGHPPDIVIIPTELRPRWRTHGIVRGLGGQADSIGASWLCGGTAPYLEQLLRANWDRLPGDLSILTRLERIATATQSLHEGTGRLADAFLIARTVEAFDGDLELPPEDLALLVAHVSEMRGATIKDIRTASLVTLTIAGDAVSWAKRATSRWIRENLPKEADADAIWILEHQAADHHVEWWLRAVRDGLADSLDNLTSRWAAALWRWWSVNPNAVDWTQNLLRADSATEASLFALVPADLNAEVRTRLVAVCAKHQWARLFARLVRGLEPLGEPVRMLREMISEPELGLDVLLELRAPGEVIATAATCTWQPLVDRAGRLTVGDPDLLNGIDSDAPGALVLFAAHLKARGRLHPDAIDDVFIRRVFDGCIDGDEACLELVQQIGARAGAVALAYANLDELWESLGPAQCESLLAATAAAWLDSFVADEQTMKPGRVLGEAIRSGARAAFSKGPIRHVISFFVLFDEVSESEMVEWLSDGGFLWRAGDAERLGGLLVERGWAVATRSFRYSWKNELKMVAWQACSLLNYWDRASAPPPGFTDDLKVAIQNRSSGQKSHMKILFLAANPTTSPRLRIDEEVRAIEEKVGSSKLRDAVQFRSLWATRPGDLQQALLKEDPDVVHFSGHGGGTAGVVLHSEAGTDTSLVSSAALAQLFAVLKDNIRLVVLNACYSEEQARAIVEKIDFVVGMTDSIGDDEAGAFAAAFYRGLAYGKSVQTAFDLGLNELQLKGLMDDEAAPVLLIREGVDASAVTLL